MADWEQQHELWDSFLHKWPISFLRSMTLDEYSAVGSKDCFTYWIEARLDKMGSIWGGSAFKFGVYARKDTTHKQSDGMRSYSGTHAWYTVLGTTAEEAFENIRERIVRIAELSRQGELDQIEAIDQIGDAYKWKIAFHYQDRDQPAIVNVFKPVMLAAYEGGNVRDGMAALNHAVMGYKPEHLDVLAYGEEIWTAWSRKNLAIWKVSHGNDEFTAVERQQYLDECKIAMSRDTNGPGGSDQQKARQGRDFEKAKPGTLFYLCHGNRPQLLGVMTGDVEPCPHGDGWVQRSYRKIMDATSNAAFIGSRKSWSPSGNSTFWKVQSADLMEFESSVLQPHFDMTLEQLAGYEFDEEQDCAPIDVGRDSEPQPRCFNQIYYGPPGTGKTYRLHNLLKQDYTEAKASDQDWRAQYIDQHIAGLKWWEGIAAALHDLGGRAKVGELIEHPFIRAVAADKGRSSDIRATLWGTLQNHCVAESETVKIKLRHGVAIFDKTAASVWHFAGDWQEACESLIELVDTYRQGRSDVEPVKRYSFTTFHQSYGYEDFVEGLRPVLDDNEDGEIRYEIKPGIFKQLCERARAAPAKRFAMVIDEINRGNVSKIFGELITLVEADKRQSAQQETTVVLPYSREAFSVPANIDIIGTMNTADRSLALLDTALRRRFDFVPMMPDCRDEGGAPLAGLRVTENEKTVDIPHMLQKINARIEALYDRDHCIGHAYFTTLGDVNDGNERLQALAQVFRQRILPLLEEYFFEDWQKIRLILADHRKPAAAQFIHTVDDAGDAFRSLFGADHGLDDYAVRRRFRVHDDAFANADAYIGIYAN